MADAFIDSMREHRFWNKTPEQWMAYIYPGADSKSEIPNGEAFHSYEEVLNAPPVAFAIQDFLQQDAITLFGGPPAAMKTYCALSVAKSLLSEDPLFDYFNVNARAKQVIYLSPESALGPFSERIKKLNLLPYVLDGSFLFSTISAEEPIRNLRDERLMQRIAGADVFLDTVVRFSEGDENSAEAQRVFADNLFWLLKQGARTIIGLHHAPKAFSGANAITLDNVLRGSGDIGAMAATVWGFSKIDDEKSQIYVKCVKDRDFRETPQPFVIEGRPHLDEQGKFKMLQTPGSAKQTQRNSARHNPDMTGEEASLLPVWDGYVMRRCRQNLITYGFCRGRLHSPIDLSVVTRRPFMGRGYKTDENPRRDATRSEKLFHDATASRSLINRYPNRCTVFKYLFSVI